MIYLVRHGETNLNRQKKFYGLLDVSINETGISQGVELAKTLGRIQLSTIYVSGLRRTLETALIIKGDKQLPIKVCSDLNEKGFGLWEGLDANQIERLYPKEWKKWLAEPFSVQPPKGEDFYHFQERVLKGLEGIIQEQKLATIEGHDKAILIVGHLGALRVIHHKLKPEVSFWDFDIPQSSYVIISIDELLKSGSFSSSH